MQRTRKSCRIGPTRDGRVMERTCRDLSPAASIPRLFLETSRPQFMRHLRPFIAVAAIAAGCASAPKPADTSSPATVIAPQGSATTSAPVVKKNPDVISEAELTDPTILNMNAYEAVRRLRPNFLVIRGVRSVTGPPAQVHISIEGGPIQPLAALKDIPAHEVKELRYLSASDAGQRFGTAADAGPVIMVKRK